MTHRRWMSPNQRAAVGFVACLALAPTARAQEEPAVAQLGQDRFMSGSDVRLEDEVFGDALLVGGSIDVMAIVHGDGAIAGHELDLRGPFRSDLYAAGGHVRLDGEVAGNARLVGGDVTLGPQAAIAGGVSIAAGRVDVAGSIGRYLQVGASSTRVSGHVAGDLDVSGGELELAPSAEIDGRLIFRGPQPANVAPGARVRGDVLHVPSGDEAGPWQQLFGAGLFALLATVGLGAVGLVSSALWPRFTDSAVTTVRSRSGAALLAGLALALGGPLAVALLSLSMVGIPLALFVACAYLVSFPLGYVVAAASIGERLHERAWPLRSSAGRRALTLLAALFALGLLALVPVIGPPSIVAVTLIGMGALVLAAAGAIRRRHHAEQPTGETPSAESSRSATERNATTLI
jgi:MYXO-CTERM domain-containing protein